MTLSLSIDLGRPLELLQTSVVARLPPLRDGNKTERNGTPKSFGYVARNSEYLLKQAFVNRERATLSLLRAAYGEEQRVADVTLPPASAR